MTTSAADKLRALVDDSGALSLSCCYREEERHIGEE